MVAGHLREKRGIYHMVLCYRNEYNKRVTKEKSTRLPVKGNKKRAEALLSEWQREESAELKKRKELTAWMHPADARDTPFIVYMRDWLKVLSHSIELTTYGSYQGMLERKILPFFEAHYPTLTIREISPRHIQEFYSWSMDEDHVSANTVIHYHGIIRKALQHAYKTGLIDVNPADRVERPKKGAFVGSTYNDEELAQLFQVIKGDLIELPVLFAAYYGLRRSEVIGLKWDAFDFKHKNFVIRHTVAQVHVDGKTVIVQKDTTKTKSSNRTLPLVKPFEDALLQLRKRQAENRRLCGKSYDKRYLDYVNVNEIGELMKPQFLTSHFQLILKKNGMRPIRFHDLRHSCATLMYANGVSMKEIQEWLGHSNITTTSNIYTHLSFSSKENSANAILGILDNMNEE